MPGRQVVIVGEVYDPGLSIGGGPIIGGPPGGGASPMPPIYYPPVYPMHPIVIPPDAIAPGVPTHPIYIPVYPMHPIVIPPGSIGPGVPTHPIVLPPPAPAHPIVIPPDSISDGVPEHPIVLPPPGIWGGPWLPPYVDIGPPGPQPIPGWPPVAMPPIYNPGTPGSPPGIWGGPWFPPEPTHPIVLPPDTVIPPPEAGKMYVIIAVPGVGVKVVQIPVPPGYNPPPGGAVPTPQQGRRER